MSDVMVYVIILVFPSKSLLPILLRSMRITSRSERMVGRCSVRGDMGALIENLNDIDAEIIFVKNIDNVVPDRLKEPTVRFKKIIGGVLVSLQTEINRYITMLKSGKYTIDDLREMIQFCIKSFSSE